MPQRLLIIVASKEARSRRQNCLPTRVCLQSLAINQRYNYVCLVKLTKSTRRFETWVGTNCLDAVTLTQYISLPAALLGPPDSRLIYLVLRCPSLTPSRHLNATPTPTPPAHHLVSNDPNLIWHIASGTFTFWLYQTKNVWILGKAQGTYWTFR